MGNIAVLSTDDGINKTILEVCADSEEAFFPVYLRDRNLIVQHLNYELPEVIILNQGDRYINLQEILGEIRRDPWLHYGGFVVIHQEDDEKEVLKHLAGINLISLIHAAKLEQHFPRLLRILVQNRWILYQRDLHVLLQSKISGSFVLENDPFDLITYSNLLANFLYNSGLINHEQRVSFYVALMELLMNAIEHGNCCISYEEKSAYLEAGGDILELIREKNQDAEVARRKVYLSYRIEPRKSSFSIRDEGQGFDWRAIEPAKGQEGLGQMHGRGIFMARLYLSQLSFNDAGNEVFFEIDHTNQTDLVPQAFSGQEELVFRDGEVVFTQGDRSSHLYYIVAGQFEIIANGKIVSILTPADIFLGEMSFLLNNRRSATVRCQGEGTLIRISKESFINAIKDKPHYGIFLARLLAQRLVRLHPHA